MKNFLALFLLLTSFFVMAKTKSNVILNECQGEGCGCFQEYRVALNKNQSADSPIKTIRPFVLYERMDKSSKRLGSFKPGVMAKPLGNKSLVREKGEYIVNFVNKNTIPLKSGEIVDTLFYIGEGYIKVRNKGAWIEFNQEDVKLSEKLKTVIDNWLEVSIGGVHGFTQDSPFESCLEYGMSP